MPLNSMKMKNFSFASNTILFQCKSLTFNFELNPSMKFNMVNGESIDYVTSCRYFGFSVNEDLRSFFGSDNSILTSVLKPKKCLDASLIF